jgi:hypothetical protein
MTTETELHEEVGQRAAASDLISPAPTARSRNSVGVSTLRNRSVFRENRLQPRNRRDGHPRISRLSCATSPARTAEPRTAASGASLSSSPVLLLPPEASVVRGARRPTAPEHHDSPHDPQLSRTTKVSTAGSGHGVGRMQAGTVTPARVWSRCGSTPQGGQLEEPGATRRPGDAQHQPYPADVSSIGSCHRSVASGVSCAAARRITMCTVAMMRTSSIRDGADREDRTPLTRQRTAIAQAQGIVCARADYSDQRQDPYRQREQRPRRASDPAAPIVLHGLTVPRNSVPRTAWLDNSSQIATRLCQAFTGHARTASSASPVATPGAHAGLSRQPHDQHSLTAATTRP